MISTPVFIAVGSNIEPKRHIDLCLEQLRIIPGFTLVKVSSWYKTRAWGVEDQADFLNLVVGGTTELSPYELLAATQQIENALGRVRLQKNGPRCLDLDLLLYGDQIISTPNLVIPHAGLLERDFMLIPLIEIAADSIYPGLNVAVKELTQSIQYHQILSQIAQS